MRTSRAFLMLLGLFSIAWSLVAHADQVPDEAANRTDSGNVRYSVAVSGERAVLVDGVTGDTWLLTESPIEGEPPAWLPLRKIDSSQEVRDWRLGNRQGDERLATLRTQLEFMQKRFAPGNARVVELQEQIEHLEQAIEEKLSDAKADRVTAISNQLFPLLLEEMDLLQKYGEDHPEVKVLQKKIELTRNFLKQSLLKNDDR